MVLLTGGASARFGAPKHLQPHPKGGSWASHLVDQFLAAFQSGPIRILGEPVPGRPQLTCLDDRREGPARALAGWARSEPTTAVRWWVIACDQVRWEAGDLIAWHAAACLADPEGEAWVMAELEGEVQPLGGFLGGKLLPALGRSPERRLMALARSLPTRIQPWQPTAFLDLDDPEAAETWLRERRQPDLPG